MDPQKLWQTTLAEVELTISKASFNTWFKTTCLAKRQGGSVTIGCANNFTKEWLENKYHKIILKALRTADPEIKFVEYIITASTLIKPVAKKPTAPSFETLPLENQLELGGYSVDRDTGLNSRYTFENFVVGSHNELAHAAALAVTEKPGTQYNPLFIYGGVGLGKTHLLQAIGHVIYTHSKKKKKIAYITSQKFTEDIVTAIRRETIDELKKSFRTTDVLLIDDIQFIAGKDKTQEELFHIFNTLYQNNKQIVFTSDRPPKAISSIEDRLRSRFEGGMIVDIGAPDYETRIAILKAKLQQLGVSLDEEVVERIASNAQRNIRELEGALNRILAYIKIRRAVPAAKEIDQLLEEMARPNLKHLNPKQIIKIVGDFYDLNETQIMKKSRSKELVKPRQIIMYLLREILKMSYPNIGEKMGGKDHTTVIHACDKIEREISYNSNLSQEISTIKERILRVD
jgi:chromosomal replication initiator protein